MSNEDDQTIIGPSTNRWGRANTPAPMSLFLEDSLALYNAVANGDGRSMVSAYGKAARNAIAASVASAPQEDQDQSLGEKNASTSEEKVDEFYLQRQLLSENRVSTSGSGLEFGSMSPSIPHHEVRYRNNGHVAGAAGLLSPLWIRQYTRSSSFVLGNYYMQNMMHHPWASASLHDCQTSLQDLNCLLKKCQQPDCDCECGNMMADDAHPDHAAVSLPGARVELNTKKKDVHTHCATRQGLNVNDGNPDRSTSPSPKKTPLLSSPCILDEDVRFLARVLSNARPPPDFVYTIKDAARARRQYDSAYINNAIEGGEDEDSINHGSTVLFDGNHGANNGTLLHLACIADSPLAVAFLLVFGGDPSMRFTAFRRLAIHEAACCGSSQCLTLLLELSDALQQQEVTTHAAKAGRVSTHSLRAEAQIDDSRQGNFNLDLSCADAEESEMVEDSKPAAAADPFSCGSNKKLQTLSPSNIALDDPKSYGKYSFVDTLSLVLDLQTAIDERRMSQLDAARKLLGRVGIPRSVRQSIAATLPISTATDGHGNTSLHWAAFKNEVGAVKVLLNYGADANFRANHSGWTPLHDAAYSDSAEAVELLLEAGASLDTRSNSGATPLCFAAQEDSPQAVQSLLRAGADPGVQCCGHNAHANFSERILPTTITGIAAIGGRVGVGGGNAVGQYQINHNNNNDDDLADIFLEINESETANNNLSEPNERQRQQEQHEAQRFMFVSSRFSGYTPLHYCAHYNADEAAKVLLRYHAPMEVEDMSHRRPIHVAAARGSSDVLRELLKAGACVETYPKTPVAVRRRPRGSSTVLRHQFASSPVSSSALATVPSSAPSRLESSLLLVPHPRPHAHHVQHPQGREGTALGARVGTFSSAPLGILGTPLLPLAAASRRDGPQNIAVGTTGGNNQVSVNLFPASLPMSRVSSPVLKTMIPNRPVISNKPWNCLTQKAIDDCNQLINAAEGHWTPETHQVFSPADRRAVLELLRVGKRLEQEDTGLFLDLWPIVLSFCGRGWFELDHQNENILSSCENVLISEGITPFNLDEDEDEESDENTMQDDIIERNEDCTLTALRECHANIHEAHEESTQFHLEDYGSPFENEEEMDASSSDGSSSHEKEEGKANLSL